MNRPQHMLIGAAFGLVVNICAPEQDPAFIAMAMVGATLPDLDQNWADRRVPHPKSGSACQLFEHRGPTHSILAAVLLGLVVASIAPWFGLALAAGYLSHLVADGTSYMGVPFLWPLSWRRLRLLPYGLRLRSGGWADWPVALIIASVSVLAYVTTYHL